MANFKAQSILPFSSDSLNVPLSNGSEKFKYTLPIEKSFEGKTHWIIQIYYLHQISRIQERGFTNLAYERRSSSFGNDKEIACGCSDCISKMVEVLHNLFSNLPEGDKRRFQPEDSTVLKNLHRMLRWPANAIQDLRSRSAILRRDTSKSTTSRE